MEFTDKNENSGRRRFLEMSSTALATATLPIGSAVAKEEPSGDISADMVDPDDPESAEQFFKRAMKIATNSGDLQDVKRAYANLTRAQENAVADAISRLMSVNFELKNEVSPQSGVTAKTGTVKGEVPPDVTVHVTDVTLTVWYDSEGVYDASVSSAGTATAPLWHHRGLVSEFLNVDESAGTAFGNSIHRYVHSVLGNPITTEHAGVDLEADANGDIDVVRRYVVEV